MPHLIAREKHKHLADQVYDKYYLDYGWHYMSVGLHKLLAHIPQLQKLIDYPVAFTSEEAFEGGHKVIKKNFRRHIVPKSAPRVAHDLIREGLSRADPKIASMYVRAKNADIHADIPPGVCALLLSD